MNKLRSLLVPLIVCVIVCVGPSALAESDSKSSSIACAPASIRASLSTDEILLQQEEGSRKFREAMAIREPAKRREALEKFAAEFPNHFSAGDARLTVLESTAKDKDNSKLLQEAEAILAALERPTAYVLQRLSRVLLNAGFVDRAAEVAMMSVTEATRTAEQIVRSAESSKATALEQLGRSQYRQKKLVESEQSFKEAYAIDPNTAGVAPFLAFLAQERKDDAQALDYMLSMSSWTASDRQRLESLYRKRHNNTLAGLEEELDARYSKSNSGWVAAERYRPSPARSSRVVLAEVFSGSGCGPCVAADLAFEALRRRYNPQEVVVLFYHTHVPVPDPLANSSSIARYRYYVRGAVPSAFLDGMQLPPPGGDRRGAQNTYTRVIREIDKHLEVAAEIDLQLTATLRNGIVTANAKAAAAGPMKDAATAGARGCADPTQRKLRLHIALAEDYVRYSGQNGIRFHAVTVRDMAASDGTGAAIKSQGPSQVIAKFDLAEVSARLKKYLDGFEESESADRNTPFKFSEKTHAIDPTRLAVVAFVQDETTRDILQSQIISFAPSTTDVTRR